MADQNAKSSPRRVRSAQRRQEVLRLRIAGASYRLIAEQLGISHERVRQLLREAMKQLADVSDELRAELRKLELERLDTMQIALWGQVTQGDQGAIDRVLRIMQRRAELLGLDAERKGELVISHPTIEDVMKRVFPDEVKRELEAGQDQAA